MKHLKIIFEQFDTKSQFISAAPHGNGFINSTYLIRAKKDEHNIGYIMQRINTSVFLNISGLMNNIELVCEHIITNNSSALFSKSIKTYTGKTFFCETLTENCWRLYDFIENSITFEKINEPIQFYDAGKAFGRFQKDLKDFDTNLLVETIKNFHNTPVRLERFLIAAKKDIAKRKQNAKEEIDFLIKNSHYANIITNLLENKQIPLRVAHNDTKLNNVLFCSKTKKPLYVIDLDTIMPGSLLYDFGDAIRFGASTAKEDEKVLSKIDVDLNLFTLFTKGFLEETISFITEEEVKHLAVSVLVITYELSLRFLTDYLNGDVYFKVKHKNQNLQRAKAQIKLLQQQIKKFEQMNSIVNEIYNELKIN